MSQLSEQPVTKKALHMEHDEYLTRLCNKLHNGECHSYVCCFRGCRIEGKSLDAAAEVETTCTAYEIYKRLHHGNDATT